MNILFLTPRDSETNLGGVEGHVRILRGELEKRGHKVEELNLDSILRLPRPDFIGARNDKIFAWMYLWRNRKLFKWAEVVHIHDVFWWVLPLLPVIWWDKIDCHGRRGDLAMTKTKVFVTFHGWEGVCPPTMSAVIQKRLADFLSDGTIGVGNFFKKWYGVETDRVVWGVVAPAVRSLSSEASSLAPESVATAGFGLASGFLHEQKSGPVRKIVFLGRLEEVNGIEILLSALKVRPWRTPGSNLFRLIFVGDGSYRKQAEKFGKVTGMVKNPLKYLVDADVVIASSYMSMLEAAAMGKPVIAIANNELKMDYLNCHPLRKWIKVVKNVDELYKGLTLASQGETLRGLGAAREWAIKQTPKKLADSYESLWKISIN